MKRLERGCVLDAVWGVKLFVNDAMSANAKEILRLKIRTPSAELSVPDLFFTECANVLGKYVVKANRPADQALAELKLLKLFNLNIVPSLNLLDHAFALATTELIAVYDALYVALSIERGVPLVTADEKLIKKLASSKYNIVSLESLVPA